MTILFPYIIGYVTLSPFKNRKIEKEHLRTHKWKVELTKFWKPSRKLTFKKQPQLHSLWIRPVKTKLYFVSKIYSKEVKEQICNWNWRVLGGTRILQNKTIILIDSRFQYLTNSLKSGSYFTTNSFGPFWFFVSWLEAISILRNQEKMAEGRGEGSGTLTHLITSILLFASRVGYENAKSYYFYFSGQLTNFAMNFFC